MAFDPVITGFLAQGLAAARPAAPNEDTTTLSWWYSTDTLALSYYDWNAAAWVPAGGFTAASTTEQLTGTSTTKGSTPDSVAALWEQGADVASAGTISLGEGGFFHVTGTTTITDIDFATDKAGRTAWVEFTGALILTHNAATLILPTGANITTVAGDTACFVSEGADAIRCVSYQRKDGTALASTSSGTAIDLYSPPTAASFATVVNGGAGAPAPSASDVTGLGMVFQSGPTQAGDRIRGVYQNVAGATPWSYIARLRVSCVPQAHRRAGLSLTDGTKFINLALGSQTNATVTFPFNWELSRYTNSTTFSATSIGNLAQTAEGYAKVLNDGANLTWSISADGRNWVPILVEAIGAFLGAITQVGIAANANRNIGIAAGDTIYCAVPYWLQGTT